MAKPRVFVSSTCYDLAHLRSDIERFIKEFGYEPILNEKGSIPYGRDKKLEDYCYREIELCDIFISIIGGKFGSKSEHSEESISQMEIENAYKLNKQIYIFIDRNVNGEYQTYLLNKGKKIKYKYVDDIKVYEHIEKIKQPARNNVIFSFENPEDIFGLLKEQWAGLFHSLLQQQMKQKEFAIIEEINNTSKTLNQLVTYLTKEKENSNDAVNSILLINHPAIEELRAKLKITPRIFFSNKKEIEQWLKAYRYTVVDKERWDSPEAFEYLKDIDGNQFTLVKIKNSIFDENDNLVICTKENWDAQNIVVEIREYGIVNEDDEVPF